MDVIVKRDQTHVVGILCKRHQKQVSWANQTKTTIANAGGWGGRKDVLLRPSPVRTGSSNRRWNQTLRPGLIVFRPEPWASSPGEAGISDSNNVIKEVGRRCLKLVAISNRVQNQRRRFIFISVSCRNPICYAVFYLYSIAQPSCHHLEMGLQQS